MKSVEASFRLWSLLVFLLLLGLAELTGPTAVGHAQQQWAVGADGSRHFSIEADEKLSSQGLDDRDRPQERAPVRAALSKRLGRMRFLKALGLTPEQRRNARRLFARVGPRTQQLKDELQERQDAFNQAIFAETYDAELVQQRLQAVLEKQQELMRNEVETERAFFEILTPEQQNKFRDLHARQLEIRRLHREVREKERELGLRLRSKQQ